MSVLKLLFGDVSSAPLEPYVLFTMFSIIVFTGVLAIVKGLALIEKWIVDGGGAPANVNPRKIRKERIVFVSMITVVMMVATFAVLMLWQSNVRARTLIDEKRGISEQLKRISAENVLLTASLDAEAKDFLRVSKETATLAAQNAELLAERESTKLALTDHTEKLYPTEKVASTKTLEFSNDQAADIGVLRSQIGRLIDLLKLADADMEQEKSEHQELQEKNEKLLQQFSHYYQRILILQNQLSKSRQSCDQLPMPQTMTPAEAPK